MFLRDEDLKLLYDIERAARRLLEFVSGKTLEQYQVDVMLRSAVERQFEIIGEATNRLGHHSDGCSSVAPEFTKHL